MARHRRLCALRPFDVARPRVAFHWTQQRNFEAIAREGLRVPDGALAVAHGSSFGLGVYVSPEFRYGKARRKAQRLDVLKVGKGLGPRLSLD